MTDSRNIPGKGSARASDERPSNSSSFLKRLGDRDEEAWRRLAELYGPLVLHWCRRARLRSDDAADVLQEVFRTVAQRVASFDHQQEGGTFRGWLWSITRNKLGDFIRTQRHEAVAAGGSEHQQFLAEVADRMTGSGAAVGSPADEIVATGGDALATPGGLYQRCFDMIRAEFEEQSWQAFWRTAVEGQLAADVAAALGTSVNAVYLAKSRILRRLREELGEE